MTGFQSQSGSVGFRTQAVKGTYLTPSAGVFMKLKSGSLGGDRTLMIPDPEIGGGRDVPDALLGPIKFSGEYAFYARLDGFATLLYGALGTNVDTADNPVAGANRHVITPTDSTLPWLSVEENIGNGYEYFRYTDAKVNTLHLEAAADGYVEGTAGLIALSQRTVASASATPTVSAPYDNSPLSVGTNVTVSFGGNVLPAKKFTLDINNNLEDDDFRLGSLFLGDTVEKRRELTAGITLRPNDSALWRQAMYGSPTATSAGGQVTHGAVQIVISTYEFITGTTVYSLTIDVPVAVLKPFAVSPSGDDVIEHDVEIQFLRPNPAVPIVTATVYNGLATVK